MKKTLVFLIPVVLVMMSCQTKYNYNTADPAATKVAINKIMDEYNAAFNARNGQLMCGYYADDILYCGTDPKEFWNKSCVTREITEMFSDTTRKFDSKVSTRQILVDRDGQSALVVEQMLIKQFSEKLPVRMIFHLVRVENKWQFDFVSASFIPANEDFEKVNLALK